MNTDNMSILGLTIDYGPYGWVDNFDPDWTPNTTDAHGRRYRFGHQPRVAYWNLGRLAAALVPVMARDADLHAGLQRYVDVLNGLERENTARKLGVEHCRDGDLELRQTLEELMTASEMDMSITWRALARIDSRKPSLEPLQAAFYDDAKRDAHADAWMAWLHDYARRVQDDSLDADTRHQRMQQANPRYVLRNYLAQQVIDQATQGDASGIDELLDVMRTPYAEQPGREAFAQRRPDWARNRAGCSMLSCSS
jgi:uncharacterized protein YdiU (UPF0061 family)